MRTGQCWDRGVAAAGVNPVGSLSLRGPRWPAASPPPAPTHALLTARSFITYTLLHTHSTPVPGLPGTHSPRQPVPEPHPSGSRVFPSSQVPNSLLCSSPRQSIPVQAAAANAASPHCSTQFRQAAAGHGSARGATNPQTGQPYPDTHTPCLQGATCQARRRLWHGKDVTQWAR